MSTDTPAEGTERPLRFCTDDADTATACTCGATKAQAWLDALIAERDALAADPLHVLLADEDRALAKVLAGPC